MKITLDELALLNAIVENGSFSAAAEQLDLAASVVSRRLKSLETKLDTHLLHRTTRHMGLTQEGQWLYEKAADTLAQVSDIETHFLAQEGQPQGTVSIDAATPFTLHAIAPLIAGLHNCYPGINIVLESSESNINLIERKVDMAIRIGELEDTSLKAKKLGDTYRGIYAAPDYIKRYDQPENGEALSQHRCLGFSKHPRLNTWPVMDNNNKPITITPHLHADSGETLRQLALHGNGIACLSAFSVRDDVNAERFVPVLKDKTEKIPIPVYLVYYSDKATHGRVRCVIDYIAEHINLQG